MANKEGAFKKLSEEDLEKLRVSGYGEMLEMLHSGAIEIQGKGTWDAYVEQCKSHKKKTPEEIKKELKKYPIPHKEN